MHYNDLKQQYFTPSTSGESYWNGYKGRAEVTYQKWYTQRLEWLVNYALDVQNHSIKAVAGYTYENAHWERCKLLIMILLMTTLNGMTWVAVAI